MGGYNEHLEGNLPCNPWNVNHWAGASSSGSGVATAAGFAYSTLGSDTVRPRASLTTNRRRLTQCLRRRAARSASPLRHAALSASNPLGVKVA